MQKYRKCQNLTGHNLRIHSYLCAMSKIKRGISVVILFLSFLPVIIPREFVHELFGHEDTTDHYHAAVILEKGHTHCSILNITFSNFISCLKNPVPEKKIIISFYTFAEISVLPGISVNLSSLRAPPAYIF